MCLSTRARLVRTISWALRSRAAAVETPNSESAAQGGRSERPDKRHLRLLIMTPAHEHVNPLTMHYDGSVYAKLPEENVSVKKNFSLRL